MTCAVVGIGRAIYSRDSGRTTRGMAVAACRDAIALCCVVAYACARITEKDATVVLLVDADTAADPRIRAGA